VKILVATPAYDQTVTVAYVQAILKTTKELLGIVELVPMFITTAVIEEARNIFASRVLEDTSFTHLLFVDADMGFGPNLVRRMLDFDKDVVGCLYPRRTIDLDRFHTISRQVADPTSARMIAQNYASGALVRSDLGDGRTGYVVTRGFVQARQVGMGITLIKRSALERMRQAYPQLAAPAGQRYKSLGVGAEVFQAFASMPDETGIYISEDLAFCERWQRIGGEIWVCADELITHVGRMDFKGRFVDRLAFESTPKP